MLQFAAGIEPRLTADVTRLGGASTVDAAFLSRAIENGYLHQENVSRACETAWDVFARSPLVGGAPFASATCRWSTTAAWEVKGAVVFAHREDDGWSLKVAGESRKAVKAWLARALRTLPSIAMSLDDDQVVMSYWYLDKQWGPQSFSHRVKVGEWSTISANYPGQAGAQLAALAAVDSQPDARIVMLHGTPGTGKTRLLAGMSKTWQSWADFHVVMDPDELLCDKSYLFGVLNRASREERTAVLVLEDCDRFVDQRTKNHSEPGVAALLNVTDGLLGELANLVVILTTNVEFDQLDAALLRPGRCLANVHVDRFTTSEAQAWLAAHGANEAQTALAVERFGETPTLAELYDALR